MKSAIMLLLVVALILSRILATAAPQADLADRARLSTYTLNVDQAKKTWQDCADSITVLLYNFS